MSLLAFLGGIDRYRDEIAVVDSTKNEGEDKYSYGDIDELSDVLAQKLSDKMRAKVDSHGRTRFPTINAGNPVAVYIPQSVEYVIAILAVWKAKLRFIPISRDSKTPPLDRHKILMNYDNLGDEHYLKFLLVSTESKKDFFYGRVREYYIEIDVSCDILSLWQDRQDRQDRQKLDIELQKARGNPYLGLTDLNRLARRVLTTRAEPSMELRRETEHSMELRRETEHLDLPAYDVCSSGSTGAPKTIENQHRGLREVVKAHTTKLELKPGMHVLWYADPGFDAHLMEIFMALCSGGKLHIMPPQNRKVPIEIFEYCLKEEIRVAILTPTVLRSIVENIANLPKLKYLVCTGEALSLELLITCLEANRNLNVVNGYGVSECHIASTLRLYSRKDLSALRRMREVGSNKLSIGKPVQGCTIMLLPEKLSDKQDLALPALKHPIQNNLVPELGLAALGISIAHIDSTSDNIFVFPSTDPTKKLIAHIVGNTVGMGYLNVKDGSHESKKFRKIRFVSPEGGLEEIVVYNTSDSMRLNTENELIFLERTDPVSKGDGVQADAVGIATKLAKALKLTVDKDIFVFSQQNTKDEREEFTVIIVTPSAIEAFFLSEKIKEHNTFFVNNLPRMPRHWKWLSKIPPDLSAAMNTAGKDISARLLKKKFEEGSLKHLEDLSTLQPPRGDPNLSEIQIALRKEIASILHLDANELDAGMPFVALGASSMTLRRLREVILAYLVEGKVKISRRFIANMVDELFKESPYIKMFDDLAVLIGDLDLRDTVYKHQDQVLGKAGRPQPFVVVHSVTGRGQKDFEDFFKSIVQLHDFGMPGKTQECFSKLRFITFDAMPIHDKGIDVGNLRLLVSYYCYLLLEEYPDYSPFYVAGYSTGGPIAYLLCEALEKSDKTCIFISLDAVPSLDLMLLSTQEHIRYLQTLNLYERFSSHLNIPKEQFDKNKPTFDEKESKYNAITRLFEAIKDSIDVFNGLKFQKISGDGLCFFDAIGIHIGQDPQDLRKSAAENMKDNVDSYLKWWDGTSDDFIEYIKKIRTGKECGDDRDIKIIQQLLGRPIIILKPDKNPTIPENIKSYKGEPIFVYDNGRGHYDAFILKYTCNAKKTLADIQGTIEEGQILTYNTSTQRAQYSQQTEMTKKIGVQASYFSDEEKAEKMAECDLAKRLVMGVLDYYPQTVVSECFVIRAEYSQMYSFFRQRPSWQKSPHAMGWPTRGTGKHHAVLGRNHFTLFNSVRPPSDGAVTAYDQLFNQLEKIVSSAN